MLREGSSVMVRIAMLCVSCVVLSGVFASANTTATPAPNDRATTAQRSTAKKKGNNRFTYNGGIRAYYFTRENASRSKAGAGQYNQSSFNTALRLHGQYQLSAHVTAGATYIYANPLGMNGPCSDTTTYGVGGSCAQYPKPSSAFLQADTTLPAFELGTLSEAYLQYNDHSLYAKLGNQLFVSPWANPSDGRVKAAYFEGADVHYALTPGWSVGVTRMIQWESRTSSDFNKSDLIVPLAPSGAIIHPTTGFLLWNVAYAHENFSGDINSYQFYDVARLTFAEGKYTYTKSPLKPYIAGQYLSETNAGKAFVGIVSSSAWGVQAGANFGRNVAFSASYDDIPWKSSTTTAASCTAAAAGYWLPVLGTPICQSHGGGSYTIYYGGVASPYTDGYATDPLYTTSISQGMSDRRSGGDSYRFALTVHSDDNRFLAIISRAGYNYSNGAGSEHTYETDVDAMYFFNKVGNGPYHGLLLRHRYAERTQSNTELFGGLPLFKYNRTQLEYDF